MTTVANRIGSSDLKVQSEVNQDGVKRLKDYFFHHFQCHYVDILSRTFGDAGNENISDLSRQEAVQLKRAAAVEDARVESLRNYGFLSVVGKVNGGVQREDSVETMNKETEKQPNEATRLGEYILQLNADLQKLEDTIDDNEAKDIKLFMLAASVVRRMYGARIVCCKSAKVLFSSPMLLLWLKRMSWIRIEPQ